MIPGEQFGAAGLAAQVRGPCPRQIGTAPTVRTPPPQRRQGLPTMDRPYSVPPTDRPHPPRQAPPTKGIFPASTSDRTFPCLGHTPVLHSPLAGGWEASGIHSGSLCLVHVSLFVSLCLCFGSLCHPSMALQPCQPCRALQLWDRNSLLGPRLSPGHRTVPLS